MASKAMAHLDLALRLCRRQVYRSGRIRPPGGAAASGFFRRSPNLRGLAQDGQTDEARTALDRLKELQPEISVAWIEENAPWTAVPMPKYVEGMRKAGLQ